jgi:hypothetical protein
MDIPSLVQDVYVVIIPHSQKWWVLCSFAYLRWRRRDVCNFHMISIDGIITKRQNKRYIWLKKTYRLWKMAWRHEKGTGRHEKGTGRHLKKGGWSALWKGPSWNTALFKTKTIQQVSYKRVRRLGFLFSPGTSNI